VIFVDEHSRGAFDSSRRQCHDWLRGVAVLARVHRPAGWRRRELFFCELCKNLYNFCRLSAFLPESGKVLNPFRFRTFRFSRGDWIRTSDLLNPISRGDIKKVQFFRGFLRISIYAISRFYGVMGGLSRILLPFTALSPGISNVGCTQSFKHFSPLHSIASLAS